MKVPCRYLTDTILIQVGSQIILSNVILIYSEVSQCPNIKDFYFLKIQSWASVGKYIVRLVQTLQVTDVSIPFFPSNSIIYVAVRTFPQKRHHWKWQRKFRQSLTYGGKIGWVWQYPYVYHKAIYMQRFLSINTHCKSLHYSWYRSGWIENCSCHTYF